MMYPLLATGLAAVAVLAQLKLPQPVSSELRSILASASSDPKHNYASSLTQGIKPKGFHSHNDYWQPVPFYTALAAGATGIEADVWLFNETLYIGHDRQEITEERTLDSLYIQPLLSVLRAQNPTTPFVTAKPPYNGVYDFSTAQTLYLFIDIKENGVVTFPYVVKALKPLRDAGFLTTVNADGTITKGPVTVVGTGTTPLDQIQTVAPRDYFFDGPLPLLNSTFDNITSAVSPIASADFSVQFPNVKGNSWTNETQLALMRAQIAHAHSKGIKMRYFGQPWWPVGTRNAIWRTLWEAGADLLNVDDMAEAADFWENLG